MNTNKKRLNIYAVCAMALLIAMMVLLKKIGAIETPYFKFSFSSLPVVLAAMILGPVEGGNRCCGGRVHRSNHRSIRPDAHNLHLHLAPRCSSAGGWRRGCVSAPSEGLPPGRAARGLLCYLCDCRYAYHNGQHLRDLGGERILQSLFHSFPFLCACPVYNRCLDRCPCCYRLYPYTAGVAPQRCAEIRRITKGALPWTGSC